MIFQAGKDWGVAGFKAEIFDQRYRYYNLFELCINCPFFFLEIEIADNNAPFIEHSETRNIFAGTLEIALSIISRKEILSNTISIISRYLSQDDNYSIRRIEEIYLERQESGSTRHIYLCKDNFFIPKEASDFPINSMECIYKRVER
jgi:hypothetical protein